MPIPPPESIVYFFTPILVGHFDISAITEMISELSWFLVESDTDKMFRAICNYLSLGQFELARALIHIHHDKEMIAGVDPHKTQVGKLLQSLVELGAPESWICSSSVPSTAHLLCMCLDVLVDLDIPVSEILKRRCQFDLLIALTYLEQLSDECSSTRVSNELRVRFAVSLLENVSGKFHPSVHLPRILISRAGSLTVLVSVSVPGSRSRNTFDQQLTAEINAHVFALCRSAPKTGVGLLEQLHKVAPVTSAQLTHIQAALVADALMNEDWVSVFRAVRFLHELGRAELLVSSPLLLDLMSLLVLVVNSAAGTAVVKQLQPSVIKFISDCLSTTHGTFPLVTKKRRSLFSLVNTYGKLASKDAMFCPDENLRLSLYESLSTLPTTSGSRTHKPLVQLVAELEDQLLIIHCERSSLPPCFAVDRQVSFFWDAYFDFVRVAKVHCLQYPLETAVALIRRRDFALVESLLTNFNQLKPIAILLCWDDFGVDIESRLNLLTSVWRGYLNASNGKRCPPRLENAVWAIAHRFQASRLIAEYYNADIRNASIEYDVWVPIPGQSESVIDIMRKLPDHSILWVLRAALSSLDSTVLVPALANLPEGSRDGSTEASVEASFDLDVTRSYLVLRGVVRLVRNSIASSTDMREIQALCSAIERVEVKLVVLEKILTLCYLTNNASAFSVDLDVVMSLVCLVVSQAMRTKLGVSRAIRHRSQATLVRLMVSLRESARYGFPSAKVEACGTIRDWASLIGADVVCAELCDRLLGSLIPSVHHSTADAGRFVCPPKTNMELSSSAFIPRLVQVDSTIVRTAMSMNDYDLATELVSFLSLNADMPLIEELRIGERFAQLRDALRSPVPSESRTLPAAVDLPSALFLIDLAVSANTGTDISLPLLHESHSVLASLVNPNSTSAEALSSLLSWTSKVAVLLEAKTEFSSNVSGGGGSSSVVLAELILGIETLPNEPELLKDHLNRMHTQRSAIMSLVDRVDQVRHGKVNAEGEIEDLLSDAIRTLTSEGVEGLIGTGGGSSFLIQFLEYLGKVCTLVQEAQLGKVTTAVSLFDVLSEQPIDLVARMVFVHGGFSQARELCDLMGMDLIAIVESESVRLSNVYESSTRPNYFMSLQIAKELSTLEKSREVQSADICYRAILLCVERRSEYWPSSQLLEYGIAECASANSTLRKWIEERRECWNKFVASYAALVGRDVSNGFSVADELSLPDEFKSAIASVATDSQGAMDALSKMVAKAFIKQGDYIAALDALDARLSVKDESLCREALLGCLTVSHASLSPSAICELLWRVPDCDELLTLTKGFYPKWESAFAISALKLCAERLAATSNREEALADVEHVIRVIGTMASVVSVVSGGKWKSWQRLERMSSVDECIDVITDLITANQHSLAVEFLGLKSTILEDMLDELADRIELSRLRFIFVIRRSETELLERLQTSHHPLKASRLSMQLIESIELISDRNRLGRLILDYGIACEEDAEGLETELASLALFSLTESDSILDQWKPLMGRPDLVFESLLMNGKAEGITKFLVAFKSWRNDDLILKLAEKAMGLSQSNDARGPSTPRSIGLGGKWSLTGNDSLDSRIRATHAFDKCPDMPLALRLLSLLCPDTPSNAERMFAFVNELSLYLPQFLPGRSCTLDPLARLPAVDRCPFTLMPFLKQAIVSLVHLIRRQFPTLAQSLATAVKYGIHNISLVEELWVHAGLRVGLADVSDRSTQAKLRDVLIVLDSLDLAERVCYATGQDDAEALSAADVVTMQRAVLAIKIGDTASARELIDSRMSVKQLTASQLAQLEVAMRTKSTVSLSELQLVHKLIINRDLDAKLFLRLAAPKMGFLPLDPDELSDQVKALLPPGMMDGRKVTRTVVLSQMPESKSPEWSGTTTPTNCSDDGGVTIQEPVRLRPISGPTASPLVGVTAKFSPDDMAEMMHYCDKYGGPDSVVSLLMREGRMDEAIDRSVTKNSVYRIDEKVFVVACIDARADWIEVLRSLRRSKEAPSGLIPYLSAIESQLRQSCEYGPLYDYEVSMGREAQAGIVSVHLYLGADSSWEARCGWLETARRHFDSALSNKISKRFLQRRRRRLLEQAEGHQDDMYSSSSEEEEAEELLRRSISEKIPLPCSLPLTVNDVLLESTIPGIRALVELQLEVCRLMPTAPPSASLFGSIQSVSEVIDYLLMDGHCALAKTIVGRTKLPDSALCGIFDL